MTSLLAKTPQEILDKVDVNTIGKIAGGLTVLGTVWYAYRIFNYKNKQNRKKNPLPPGPTPLPLIGSLASVVRHFGPDGNPRIHQSLMDLAKVYGPIYGLWMGAYYTVVISDPTLAYEAFIKNGTKTSDRAYLQSHGGDHVPSMYIFTRNGKGIAMSTGKYWRFVRSRLQENISRPKPAATAAPVVLKEVSSVINMFRHMSERGESITNLTLQLKRESMNVAMHMIFSTRFGAKPTQDFLHLQYAVEYFFKNLSSGNPSDMIPILRWLPNPLLWDMKKVVKHRDEVLARMIQQHKDEFYELKKQGNMIKESDARDVLDLFFMDEIASKDKEEDLRMTGDKIHVSIWDMVFAMTDTTASTNEWLIYWMINYPEVQKKVQAELDEVCRDANGKVRLPTLEDGADGFAKLPYFWATIKEVMRARIISPILAPHYVSEEFAMSDGKGGQVLLPAGTQIFVNAFSMSQDPKYWQKPEEFNPMRWIDHPENKGLDMHGQETRNSVEHYKFIPFSMGPRTCPGYSFAKVSLFLQAAAMMQCFEWKLTDDAHKSPFVKNGKLDMTENWGLTIMPRHYGELGLIKAVPRAAAYLAESQPGDD